MNMNVIYEEKEEVSECVDIPMKQHKNERRGSSIRYCNSFPSSGYQTDEMSSSENSQESFEKEVNNNSNEASKAKDIRQLRRVQSTPNHFSQESREEDDLFDDLSDFRHMKMSEIDILEQPVFEEETFDSSSSSPSTSPKPLMIPHQRHPRQRYNSSSIRRTPVVPGYVSELIERRESLRVLPEGRSKDNTCIRKALQYIADPLNVLVIGPHDSGKTTLINSLLMSVTGEWVDRAPYGTGRAHNLNPVVLYENPEHHRRHRTVSDANNGGYRPRHRHFDPTWKRSCEDPCGRVVMWDTRGFDTIHDEAHQALLLRYILEGRLHPSNLSQALLLPDEICKKRYRAPMKDSQIDMILYVAAADERPNVNLFKAIIRAKEESKDEKAMKCPIMLVMTKFDLLDEVEKAAVNDNIFFYHPSSYGFHGDVFSPDFDLQDEEVLWKKVHCYESNLNPVIDRLEQNQPDEKKDEKLLKLFKDIIDYSLTPTGKRRCSSSSSKIFHLARNTGQKLLSRRLRTISI